MANELSLRATLSFSKGGAKVNRSESVSVTVTGDAFSHDIQSIGTTEEILVQSAELGTVGYVFLLNLDSTNYVEFGLTGSYPIKLKAKEIALYRHNGADIYAKANTGACLVEYVIIEE